MNKELESMRNFLKAIKDICENQRICDGCLLKKICPEIIPDRWDNLEKLKLKRN